jgi:diaminopimelate decarboxylase
MAGRPTQFGIDVQALLAGGPRWESSRVAVRGFHFFEASNVTDDVVLRRTLLGNLEVAAHLADHLPLDVEAIDLGGGFPAPFGVHGPRHPLDGLAGLGTAISQSWRGPVPSLTFESGRYLTASSGWLLTRVEGVKEVDGERFVLADAGTNCLGGMSGLGRLGAARTTPVVVGPPRPDTGDANVCGPLCTPLDVLGRRVRLPVVAAGDLLAIPNVGAYGLTASLLAFLSHRPAVEVVLDGDREEASRLDLVRRPVTKGGTCGDPAR